MLVFTGDYGQQPIRTRIAGHGPESGLATPNHAAAATDADLKAGVSMSIGSSSNVQFLLTVVPQTPKHAGKRTA